MKALEGDIALLKDWGLRPWISISNSTDPLQPLEKELGHFLYSLRRLLEEGFPVLIVTKNPGMLLDPPYLEALKEGRVRIHVTIPFLKESPLEPRSPLPKERIEAVGKLVSMGLDLGVRIDPVIPPEGGFGQSEEDLRQLVLRLSEVGVRKVYAKVLRLMVRFGALQEDFYLALRPFYQQKGLWRGSYFVLREEERVRLLLPIIEAATENKMEVFTCTDPVGLPGVRRCEFEDKGER